MATHSSILAGGNPMDREAWRASLQSIGSQRAGHDRATEWQQQGYGCFTMFLLSAAQPTEPVMRLRISPPFLLP